MRPQVDSTNHDSSQAVREVSQSILDYSTTANLPEYKSWASMIARCTNPLAAAYRNYGARGIRVSLRWLSFAMFLEDMGKRPQGTTLERRNNDGNYEPSNCVWATAQEQHRNRRDNLWLTMNGERRTLVEWAERTGFSATTIGGRLRRGWKVEDALTIPPSHGHAHGVIVRRQARVTCKQGHLLTEDNVRYAPKNGRTYRACRTCERERLALFHGFRMRISHPAESTKGATE